MEIKPGRYRTRNNLEAVVLEVFEGRAYGRILLEDWCPEIWYLSGQRYFNTASPADIIAPWEESKPRLRVWRFNSLGSLHHGTIKIISSENTNQPSGWEPVPELDLLFEKGKE